MAAFDLPWPWGGERFELRDVRPVTWIIGSLGSGKTRFCKRLAEVAGDADLAGRVQAALDWLLGEGAVESDGLVALLAGLCGGAFETVVVDLVEQGLDQPTQEALGAFLRGPGVPGRTLFVMTRSSALLDLAAVGSREAIILCPANHSPPMRVLPYPGAPGFETVASCLGTSAARARTAGVVALRPATSQV